MKILVIIPARSGSKGIPQKNIKFLHAKPLIYYAIKNANSIENADIFVSTDSIDIAHIAETLNCNYLMRHKHSDDMATIDDVAVYELKNLFKKGKQFDVVITLQPTSPLLQKETLQNALKYFLEKNLTSLVSAVEKRHLSWKKSTNGFEKLYKNRVNRQELEAIYEENGAFVICKAEYLLQNDTRISKDVELYPISENESVDIDTKDDWVLAENILSRRNIAFIANGSTSIGMGHIYRVLNLANKFYNDNIYFYSDSDSTLGIEKIVSLNYEVQQYKEKEELISLMLKDDINIVVNDILDTDIVYMQSLKKNSFFIINFEDTNIAAKEADIVFNALYEWSDSSNKTFFGYRYDVLREDIYLYPVQKSIKNKVQNILIGFGGTDIENATLKTLQSVVELTLEVSITLVLGIGYRHENVLSQYLQTIDTRYIKVIKDVKFMADYINKSDLVISGNGRMVYEVVSLGIPLIVISQNEREMSHIFPTVCPAIVYLGYIKNFEKSRLQEELLLCMKYETRDEMNKVLVEFAKEIRQGTQRVMSIINEKYNGVKYEI